MAGRGKRRRRRRKRPATRSVTAAQKAQDDLVFQVAPGSQVVQGLGVGAMGILFSWLLLFAERGDESWWVSLAFWMLGISVTIGCLLISLIFLFGSYRSLECRLSWKKDRWFVTKQRWWGRPRGDQYRLSSIAALKIEAHCQNRWLRWQEGDRLLRFGGSDDAERATYRLQLRTRRGELVTVLDQGLTDPSPLLETQRRVEQYLGL
jgi:hypothetical protein